MLIYIPKVGRLILVIVPEYLLTWPVVCVGYVCVCMCMYVCVCPLSMCFLYTLTCMECHGA